MTALGLAQQVENVLVNSADHEINVNTCLLESIVVTASRREVADLLCGVTGVLMGWGELYGLLFR